MEQNILKQVKNNINTEKQCFSKESVELIKLFVEEDEQEAFIDFIQIDNLKRKIKYEQKFFYRYKVKNKQSDAQYYEMCFVNIR